MQQVVNVSYTFAPGAARVGTLDLSAIPNFDIKQLMAVVNISKGSVIFLAGDSTRGFVSENSGVVTLIASTMGHSASDELQIIYDVGVQTVALPYGADYVSRDGSGSDFDVYTYKVGGASGTAVKTLTVTFTDSTKSVFLSAAEEIPN
jgi:hypothetical protein